MALTAPEARNSSSNSPDELAGHRFDIFDSMETELRAKYPSASHATIALNVALSFFWGRAPSDNREGHSLDESKNNSNNEYKNSNPNNSNAFHWSESELVLSENERKRLRAFATRRLSRSRHPHDPTPSQILWYVLKKSENQISEAWYIGGDTPTRGQKDKRSTDEKTAHTTAFLTALWMSTLNKIRYNRDITTEDFFSTFLRSLPRGMGLSKRQWKRIQRNRYLFDPAIVNRLYQRAIEITGFAIALHEGYLQGQRSGEIIKRLFIEEVKSKKQESI